MEREVKRLTDVLDMSQRDQAILAWWLAQSGMRFRAAAAADPAARRQALEVLRARARHVHVGPGSEASLPNSVDTTAAGR
jgi:hypothetical protein